MIINSLKDASTKSWLGAEINLFKSKEMMEGGDQEAIVEDQKD